LRAQLAFFLLHPFDLPTSSVAESGVRSQSLVVVRDLLADVLFLHLQQRLGILALHAADEEAQEPAEQVGDSSEHSALLCRSITRRFFAPFTLSLRALQAECRPQPYHPANNRRLGR
jgi:hypothetical protein